MQNTVQSILKFWFDEIHPKQWDMVNPAFDFEIKERFALAYDLALQGLCDEWQSTPDGALAFVLLTGVFPHYMYRGDYKAFDGAVNAAIAGNSALDKGYDQIFKASKRKFFYTAMLHSDHEKDLSRAVQACAAIKDIEPVTYLRAQKAFTVFCAADSSVLCAGLNNAPDKELAFVDKN